MRVHSRAERKHLWFGSVDVSDAEIEVELLRSVAAWPGRHYPVCNLLEGEGGSTVGVVWSDAATCRGQGREMLIGAVLQRPAQPAPIEAGKVASSAIESTHSLKSSSGSIVERRFSLLISYR